MQVLYILGECRGGSTLVQHLIALQPGAYALGELRRLNLVLRTQKSLCACGQHYSACDFWTRVLHECGERALEPMAAPSPWGSKFSKHWLLHALFYALHRLGVRPIASARNAAHACHRLYDSATRVSGCDLLVDSSKKPFQFLALWANGVPVAPVFLIRDGRGVVASLIRRGVPLPRAIRSWANVCRSILFLRSRPEFSHYPLVRYEDVCRSPESALQAILSPLGRGVRRTDLAALAAVRHHIGGSKVFRGSDPIALKPDERWRRELGEQELAVFERMAGDFNRSLGYAG